MDSQGTPCTFQASINNNEPENSSGNIDECSFSNGSFLIPAIPSVTSQMSADRISNARKLMQVPTASTLCYTPSKSKNSTSEMSFNSEDLTSSAQQSFCTPPSSGQRDILRGCSASISPFPDNFPLSGSSKYICGPPGGTPFPRHKESPRNYRYSSMCEETCDQKPSLPPILNLSEEDWDTTSNTTADFQNIPKNSELKLELEDGLISHVSAMECQQISLMSPYTHDNLLVFDFNETTETPSYHYLNNSIVIPPVPFNSPVTPGPSTSQQYNSVKIENTPILPLPLSSYPSGLHTSDLNDSRLMADLCEAAAKQEKKDKREQRLGKHDKQRIDTKNHSLEYLLNEMPATKSSMEEGSSTFQNTTILKKERKMRKIRSSAKERPSNKYTNLTIDELEKVNYERRQATEYKGAMSIAEKEIIRREKINDSLSMLRKIIPTITDLTENSEVFEVTARYVAFLRHKTEGKYDRDYLYENLEL